MADEVSKSERWWDDVDLPDGWSDALRMVAQLEFDAKYIQHATMSLIPGLLQTEQYISHIWQTLPPHKKRLTTSKAYIDFRIQRQWHYFERPTVSRMDILISEQVLYNEIGSPQIMIEQLRHLIKLIETKTVDIRIISTKQRQSWFMWSSPISARIHHFKYAAKPDVVEIETQFGHQLSSNSFEVESYKAEFASIWDRAHKQAEVVDMIRRVIMHYQTQA